MFGGEIGNLLIQVISSWQVLAVTVVIIIYFFLVSFVSRVYHPSSRRPQMSLPKGKGKSKSESQEAQIVDEGDDLGLEDQGPAKEK